MRYFYGLLISLVLASLACNLANSEAKECANLTKDGEAKCITVNAVKNKTCLWQNNACIEKPLLKDCSEITKDQASCEQANAIAGKTCLWMNASCTEKTAQLSKFMQADLSFETKLVGNTDAYGQDHGQTPDWDFICTGVSKNGVVYSDISQALNSVVFNFKKDSTQVDLVLDCKAGGAKTFALTYQAASLPNNVLLINLDLNGKSVMAKGNLLPAGAPASSNQLEFFSKPNWFYIEADNAIKGASQLFDLGHSAEGSMPIKTEKDINDAITYTKAHFGYIGKVGGKDVGAITLILNKK